MTNSVDTNWSGSTLFSKAGYIRTSRTRVNSCHAEYNKMPHPLLTEPIRWLDPGCWYNSPTEWQTVQIQISWLLRSQLIWIYTVFKDRVYPGPARPGLIAEFFYKDSEIQLAEWLAVPTFEHEILGSNLTGPGFSSWLCCTSLHRA